MATSHEPPKKGVKSATCDQIPTTVKI